MLNDYQGSLTLATTSRNNYIEEDQDDDGGSPVTRDIHALTPPHAPRAPHREAWETNSHQSLSLSAGSSEINFNTMSREFNALVSAGSSIGTEHVESGSSNLGRIREGESFQEETNPLAIVRDSNPMGPTSPPMGGDSGHGDGLVLGSMNSNHPSVDGEVSLQSVKKEEVLTKINAWQNAKIAKINNRFKREEAVINGWEGEQVQKATSWMKKVERKLEEKRAKAVERMQNEIAKARRKAEERKASAEAKRGTKVGRVLEIANLMRAVGRPPVKRSFF